MLNFIDSFLEAGYCSRRGSCESPSVPSVDVLSSFEQIRSQGYTTLRQIVPNVEETILQLVGDGAAPPAAARERSHRSYLNSKSSVALTTLLLEPLRPLLDYYFEGYRYRMSELQVITAPPHCHSQIFHRDQYNGPGLTLILPLCAVNVRNGGTQLLARTHRPISLFSTPFDKYTFAGNPGDICVMDSRVIHRGGENNTDKDRTILIVRFDVVGTEVPMNRGFGEIGRVLYTRIVAKALEIIG